jgi:hypothetical protein
VFEGETGWGLGTSRRACVVRVRVRLGLGLELGFGTGLGLGLACLRDGAQRGAQGVLKEARVEHRAAVRLEEVVAHLDRV